MTVQAAIDIFKDTIIERELSKKATFLQRIIQPLSPRYDSGCIDNMLRIACHRQLIEPDTSMLDPSSGDHSCKT